MSVVMKILGLLDGTSTPFDDQYVVVYDPTQQGFTPDGAPMLCRLETTRDIDQARHFDDAIEAMTLYRLSDGVRPDGRPNRPITAFNVEFSVVDAPESK